VSAFIENTEGTFFGLDEATYRNAPGVNISALKDCLTPAHYRAVRDAKQPGQPTPAQVFGRAFHALALEGKIEFATKPEGMNFTTKEGKAWRDAQTLPILTSAEGQSICAMRAALDNHSVSEAILRSGGQSEVSCFQRHAATGLMIKGRADFLTTDVNGMTTVVDLKTCGFGDASEASFAREVSKYSYHRQAAFYLDLFGATFFLFIAVEKEPPYAVNCFRLDAESIAKGREENERDLAKLAEAEAQGQWSAYPPGIHTLTLNKWRMAA
jgi:PDDEXK-like domain of unknown function (DUF3799)